MWVNARHLSVEKWTVYQAVVKGLIHFWQRLGRSEFRVANVSFA
ncbi:hypothetical protein EV13_1204 [Prochlorococcus sp. MIT 0702]|nr:hypothetical protein EV12_2466 [Prochlorococcus sp. MIT 0701]KGG29255.1 hypothetical protein EV13_1204 [Prochlorococcus sp. MIT 0702]KGG35327.1 hypothetical protein EV14_0900 [Prochlorococcus sp. MIT 0703]